MEVLDCPIYKECIDYDCPFYVNEDCTYKEKNLIKCLNCGLGIELDPDEYLKGTCICPNCNSVLDLKTTKE